MDCSIWLAFIRLVTKPRLSEQSAVCTRTQTCILSNRRNTFLTTTFAWRRSAGTMNIIKQLAPEVVYIVSTIQSGTIFARFYWFQLLKRWLFNNNSLTIIRCYENLYQTGRLCVNVFTEKVPNKVLNASTMNAKLQPGTKSRYYNAVAVEFHSETNRNYNRHLTKP